MTELICMCTVPQAIAAMGFNLTYDAGSDAYLIPCEAAVSDGLPDIGFTMNGTTYNIPPSAWITSVSLCSLTSDQSVLSLCASSKILAKTAEIGNVPAVKWLAYIWKTIDLKCSMSLRVCM